MVRRVLSRAWWSKLIFRNTGSRTLRAAHYPGWHRLHKRFSWGCCLILTWTWHISAIRLFWFKLKRHWALDTLFTNDFFGFVRAWTHHWRTGISILEISHSLGTSNSIIWWWLSNMARRIYSIVVGGARGMAWILQIVVTTTLCCANFILGLSHHVGVRKFVWL